MPDLEPITREEMLLDGEDLTPITREEMFIKRIYDKTQEIPEPVTRHEMFLKKAGEGSGDVTIEQLDVTDNGTYSEQGKAYSPVNVNVVTPLPDNAYLLKEVDGLPKDIATFSDGANLPMPSLKVSIEPVQSGSGDPSPSNVRPISGWSAVDVSVVGKNYCGELEIGTFAESSQIGSTYDEMMTANGARIRSKGLIPTFNNNIVISCDFANYQYCFCLYDADKKYLGQIDGFGSWRSIPYIPITPSSYIAIVLKRNDGEIITSADLENCHLQVELGSTATAYEPYNPNSETITIQLGDTYYGGKLDVVSGVLTLTHEIADLPSLSWGKSTNTANIYFYVLYTSGANGTYNNAATNVKSNIYTPKSRNSLTNVQGTVGVSAETNALYIADGKFDDYTVAQFKEAMSDVQLLLPLATPLEVQLTPTQVNSLEGVNNVWADCGQILEGEYFSKEA